MITNEKGMILPLVLVISLVTSSLILTIANRLESHVFSYEQRHHFQNITLLEKECVQSILDLLSKSDFISTLPRYESSSSITLSDATLVALNYYNGVVALEIRYNFSYNGYLGSGIITYNKQQQTFLLS